MDSSLHQITLWYHQPNNLVSSIHCCFWKKWVKQVSISLYNVSKNVPVTLKNDSSIVRPKLFILNLNSAINSRTIFSFLNPFVPNTPFRSTLTVFWCFHEVEKGDIGNKRVNSFIDFIHIVRQPIGLFLQGLSLHIWEVKIFSLFLTSVEVLSCLFMFAGMTFVPKIIEKIFSRWFLWQIFPCYLIE